MTKMKNLLVLVGLAATSALASTIGSSAWADGTPAPPESTAKVTAYMSREMPSDTQGPCVTGGRLVAENVASNPDLWLTGKGWSIFGRGHFETITTRQDGVSQYSVYEICREGAFVERHIPTAYVHREINQNFTCYGGSCYPIFFKTTDWEPGTW